MTMPKFMQSLDEQIYQELLEEAKNRGISLQDLIRAVIIPYWFTAKKRGENV